MMTWWIDLRASCPPCRYNHDEELEDDPQLTLSDLKKFQVNIREFSKFSMVSDKSNSIFLFI